MRHLLLLRHAKSSWEAPNLSDFDRPLNARGERDAPRIGASLRGRPPLPDYVVSSPATRARETVAAVVEAAQLPVDPQFDPDLYGASVATLMSAVRRLPPTSNCTLLVGHNPGMEELLGRLTGEWQHMPTAALAHIALDIADWDDVADDTGALEWFLTPKHLPDEEEGSGGC